MADAPDWLSVIGSLKCLFLIPIMETFVMKASFQITNVLHPMKPQPGWILKLTDPVQLCCCGTVFRGSSLLATVLVSDNGVSPPPHSPWLVLENSPLHIVPVLIHFTVAGFHFPHTVSRELCGWDGEERKNEWEGRGKRGSGENVLEKESEEVRGH